MPIGKGTAVMKWNEQSEWGRQADEACNDVCVLCLKKRGEE